MEITLAIVRKVMDSLCMVNKYKITLEDKNDPSGNMAFIYEEKSAMEALGKLAENFDIDEATTVTIEKNGR